MLSIRSYCSLHQRARTMFVSSNFRDISTTQPRHIHPLVWLVAKPFAKLGAILSGRGARKWWRALPSDKRGLFKESVSRNKWRILGSSIVLASVGTIYVYTHVDEVPLTHRRRFMAFTSDQYNKLVQFESEMLLKENEGNFLAPTHPYVRKVVRVANKLYNANSDICGRRGIDHWSVAIINDDKTENAFVLPNGQVFVFTGMLSLCHNEDQLAMVLSHEMSHAILQHSIEQVSYGQLLDVVIIGFMAALWMIIPSDGIALITNWFFHKVMHLLVSLPYSRKLEMEADSVGLQMAAKACYDVRESSVFWETMALRERERGEVSLDWLSSHPPHEERAASLDQLIPQAIELRASCNCGRLPALDPRQDIKELKERYGSRAEARERNKLENVFTSIGPKPQIHS